MDEKPRRFEMLDAALVVMLMVLLAAIAVFALDGCTIRDGYLVAEAPAISVSGAYHSRGYGGVSVGVVVPPLYPGYGYYGYDPYYSGYGRYYPPRVVYRRPYYPSPMYRTRVIHHRHHSVPVYRDHGMPNRRVHRGQPVPSRQHAARPPQQHRRRGSRR